MIRYNIIATGSTGNAVKINDILIDCGVSFKKLKDVYKHIKLVLLTHEHSDHFRPSTIRKSNFKIWLLSLDGSQVDRMWSFTNTN